MLHGPMWRAQPVTPGPARTPGGRGREGKTEGGKDLSFEARLPKNLSGSHLAHIFSLNGLKIVLSLLLPHPPELFQDSLSLSSPRVQTHQVHTKTHSGQRLQQLNQQGQVEWRKDLPALRGTEGPLKVPPNPKHSMILTQNINARDEVPVWLRTTQTQIAGKLWRSLIQPPTQSKASLDVPSGCLGPHQELSISKDRDLTTPLGPGPGLYQSCGQELCSPRSLCAAPCSHGLIPPLHIARARCHLLHTLMWLRTTARSSSVPCPHVPRSSLDHLSALHWSHSCVTVLYRGASDWTLCLDGSQEPKRVSGAHHDTITKFFPSLNFSKRKPLLDRLERSTTMIQEL